MKIIYLILFFFLAELSAGFSQKQANSLGAEEFADAPYRMKKYNDQGTLNAIPIHFFVHDASGFGFNVELMNIRIKIKNATDTVFNDLITFNNYSDSAFQSLIVCRSPNDNDLDIQDFNASGAVKDSVYTIDFISDTNSFPFTTFVNITHDYWWFTLMIPSEKLQGYDDIVDFEIYFEMDWATDYTCNLRVFRYSVDLPKLQDWYRGDVHCHGMYTQNDAEVGLPLDATKLAAKCIGLDWITFTDHSCDYDNYGQSMSQNWQHLGDDIALLNTIDTSFLFIRGMEMSVNNSAGDVVHALVYPDPDAPFSLPYIGDGGGDVSSTSVYIDMMLDSLEKYNGFCYAAHPFAEGDKLSELVNGSVWNISDPDYPLNGESHINMGTVVCNDTNYASDIYSPNVNNMAKNRLIGVQDWNLKNTLTIDSDPENPWNVMYDSGAAEFSPLSETNYMHHYVRFMENFDVTRQIWQRGLRLKNTHPTAENWKFFISGGSDAHGSFNYSTTDLFYGVSGNVSDNAIGKISTLAYCPKGMGTNGTNVLHALQNGHTIISTGPVINMEIETDTTNNKPEVIVGSDTVLDINSVQDAVILFYSATSDEYGIPTLKQLRAFTDSSEFILDLPLDTVPLHYNLYDLLDSLFKGQVPINEYFLVFAKLQTTVNYNLPDIYKMNSQTFESITNPIWIKISAPVLNKEVINNEYMKVYPNPGDGIFHVNLNTSKHNRTTVQITDILGHIIYLKNTNNRNFFIDISTQPAGFYYLSVSDDSKVFLKKLVIKK